MSLISKSARVLANHRVQTRIATTTDFKLLDLFTGQPPLIDEPDFKVYDGTKIPNVYCAALLHYGAGIFFKAAAHVWNF